MYLYMKIKKRGHSVKDKERVMKLKGQKIYEETRERESEKSETGRE